MDNSIKNVLKEVLINFDKIEKKLNFLEGKNLFNSANKNISNNIDDEYLEIAEESLKKLFSIMLKLLLIDTKKDYNVVDTPKRISKMYIREILYGRYKPQPQIYLFPNVNPKNDIHMIGPIKVRSLCAHHFLPIEGSLWCGIIYGSKLLGLSKFKRIVDWVMTKPQIQEEAIEEIADVLVELIHPKGIGIYMMAKHSCMLWRGVKADITTFSNYAKRGIFVKDSIFASFMQMLSYTLPKV